MESYQFQALSFKALDILKEPELEDVINKSEDDPSYLENDFGLSDGIIGKIRDNSGLKMLVVNISKTYKNIQPQFSFQEENNPRRNLTTPCEGVLNGGRDNSDNNLILYVQDEIKAPNNTYYVEELIGQGVSGQVFRVKCQEKQYALKVIKNRRAYLNQALIELKILLMLNKDIDKNDQYHIIRAIDYFYYYDHLCIVFELLNDDLNQLLKKNHYQGISLSSIRFITKQMLEAVEKFHSAKIIHCDLKPENILLKIDKDNPKGEISIKVTDFGSACSKGHEIFKYIQSRYYRAPEVIIGLPYSTEIDIWSIGCIAAELYLGGPLLPGSCEFDQLHKITELLGEVPDHLVFNGRNFKKYFKIDPKTLKPLIKSNEIYYNENPNSVMPKYKIPFELNSLDDLINLKRDTIKKKDSHNSFSLNSSIGSDDLCAFIHFLKGILNIDPKVRWNAKQSLRHPFITKEKLDKFISFCPNEISQFLYLSGDTTQFIDLNNRYSYNPYHSMIQNNIQGNRMSTYTNSYSNTNISYDSHVYQPNLQNIQMKWLKNFPYAMVDQCNMYPNQKDKIDSNNQNNTFMATSFEKINTSNEYNNFRKKHYEKTNKPSSKGYYNNFNKKEKQKRLSGFNSFNYGNKPNHNFNNSYCNKDFINSPYINKKEFTNEYEGLVSDQNILNQFSGNIVSKRTRSQSDYNNTPSKRGSDQYKDSPNIKSLEQEITEEENYQNEDEGNALNQA